MRDLMTQAIEEERACTELTDDAHDWLTAEAIGRSSEALAVAELLSVSNDLPGFLLASHRNLLGDLLFQRFVTFAFPDGS